MQKRFDKDLKKITGLGLNKLGLDIWYTEGKSCCH